MNMKRQEQYSGKVTPVGNSKGIRIDAAFFKAYPEFKGRVQVTVLGTGHALLSTENLSRRAGKDEDEKEDLVMRSFLQFLEKEMINHPEQIVNIDPDQIHRIGKLVDGVESE